MSKAFTKQTDPADEDALDRDGSAVSVAEGTRNYMTPAGAQRLRLELQQLRYDERPKLVEIVAWAASNGDRSENGDYIYGKKRLREIDRRIRFLQKRLENVEVVDPGRQTGDKVFFGATVTVAYADGAEKTYSIVGIDESDPGRGRISWISPLAKTLLKASAGDVVHLRTPGGEEELEILTVEYKTLG